MASLLTRNFRLYQPAPAPLDEDARPDSPTIMVTKSKPQNHPLLDSTISLIQTFQACNSRFTFNSAENPSRPLTKPSEPKFNDFYDNEHYNYILYVNDKLQSPEGEKYTILDSLGEGTFGQVVKVRASNGGVYAAKIIKSKPAYYIQGLIEVKILSKVNHELDPNDTSHIVKMIDYFVYRNHLVIIFELLSLNLYELLRKNNMRGFSLSLIRSCTKQVLESLCVLEQGNIIHCDLKPENILLADDKAGIKVIDLGSACFENATIYTYIQSRYYRSPEVLMGLPYGGEIDSWSLGCICAELFIGIPLFPGSSEYDQLFRIVQLLGSIPQQMILESRARDKFFILDGAEYRLKTREEYMQVTYKQSQNTILPPFKAYVKLDLLDDLATLDRRLPRDDSDSDSRQPFVAFLKGLLQLDPAERWTASQAIEHPFVQGRVMTEFEPRASKIYAEVHKSRTAPSGALRGSCPSLLQRIRGSQDATVRPGDVCFRPLVEELKDEFFTGFAHGKLVQVQKPPPPAPTQWNNPFMNVPISLQANAMKPVSRPMPDIVGPRYARPHSYEDRGQLPRPFSPMIEQDGKYAGYKGKPGKKKSKFGEHKSKMLNDQLRPNTHDDKKSKRTGDKLLNLQFTEAFAITENKYSATKAADPPTGFLSKVKKEASQQEVIKRDS